MKTMKALLSKKAACIKLWWQQTGTLVPVGVCWLPGYCYFCSFEQGTGSWQFCIEKVMILPSHLGTGRGRVYPDGGLFYFPPPQISPIFQCMSAATELLCMFSHACTPHSFKKYSHMYIISH